MSRGFLLDNHPGFSRGLLPRWHEGAPLSTFFMGAKSVGNKEPLPVGGFRCEKCGWLDLYAGREFEAR